MNWKDRSVLVTGASGLVGQHLVQHLMELGSNVIVPIRDLVRCELADDGIELRTIYPADIRDQALMERVLGDYEVRTVFHLAAQTIVTIANRNPVETWDSNVRGTWSLMEACRRSPLVEEVVVASSDKAYGSLTLPYTEDSPLAAVHPYDVSKACADMIVRSYREHFGLNAGITRCCNFFGEGDNNGSRIVPGTIRSILRGERPVIRSNGKFLRDYMYVKDGVEAYVALAEYLHVLRVGPADAKVGEVNSRAVWPYVFNFSYEAPWTVVQMVDRIKVLMGSDLESIIEDNVHGEIENQYLSAELAKRVLGWKPKYGMTDGLQRTIDWFRVNVT